MSRLAALLTLISLPVFAAPPEVSAEPKRVLLGENTTVSVRVRGLGNVRLRWAASMGELTEAGSGGFERKFSWTPPETRIPAVALLLFWVEEGDAPPDVSITRITLIGKTELEATTEPGAEVRVEVAGKLFGPTQADENGKVSVPIEVPPGNLEARVLGKREGKTTELKVPLTPPPYNPLMAILGPDPLYAEGGGWLWVFDASDLYAEKITVALRGGSAREVETTSHGTLFELTPAPRSKRLSVLATAKGHEEARAEISSQLRPGKPPEQELRRPEPTMRLPKFLLLPAVFFGGYYAGGGNLGFGAGITASVPISGPVNLDGEVGIRRQSLTTRLPSLGELSSSVTAVPITLSAQARLVSAGPWTLSARAGAGLLPFIHSVTSSFQQTATGSGLGWELFAAGEVSHDFGAVEVFLELRGAYSPVSTPQLSAQLGGVMLSLGARRSAL